MNNYQEKKTNLAGIEFSNLAYDSVVSKLLEDHRGVAPVSLVTPNIYHFFLAKQSSDFASELNESQLSVPDGWPVVHALRNSFPHFDWKRIAGSDLAVSTIDLACQRGLSIGFLGGSHTALKQASASVKRKHSAARVVEFTDNPIISDNPTAEELDRIVQLVNDSPPDVLLLCMGAPKSERIAARVRGRLSGVRSIMCVGASVDFIAGTQKRAPRFIQRLHLEWLYRVLQEPKRLGKRYLSSSEAFLPVYAGAIRARSWSR